ncbi:MAG TPA: carboxylating nicotinate-nucleotide diphosphorylase [Chthoniobacterales bacterium]|jgi:nicotinate-nucleotide pyrophosphorylase (carboxylating)|nr:carboxylating nicotinate-nucleotide diphosphorylase [Chthoniobacterales bacterium]
MEASSHDPIEIALAEDVGSGDLTSEVFIPETRCGRARIFAKEPCVVAGMGVVRGIYSRLDPRLKLAALKEDGSKAGPGDTVIELSGSLRKILTGERVALNFLQRLSGVATLTAKFVEAVRGTGAVILDTRKTTPGLRALEKAAVKAGGGQNHRMGLYDGVMIKDNHLLAKPDLQNAIDSIRKSHPGILIEVEADTVDQVREFVQLKGIDVILLDNMSAAELRASIALKKADLKFEASGGVSLETARQIAETGVDFISVGQLTHSARAIDFSLELLDA